jgi:hypothetical protein
MIRRVGGKQQIIKDNNNSEFIVKTGLFGIIALKPIEERKQLNMKASAVNCLYDDVS